VSDSHGAKPDLLVPFLVLIFCIVAVYYVFPPFRLFLKGFLCYLYSLQSYLVLDLKTAKKFQWLGYQLLYHWKAILHHYSPEQVDGAIAALVNEIRLRLFVFATGVLCLFAWYFRSFSRQAPSFYGKYDFKQLLREKYGFKLPGPGETVEDIYQRLSFLKKRKNIPVNLVARLFPRGSKERIFIYKGSYNYDLKPISMEKTLSEISVEVAERDLKEEEES